jgi:hypothetical protein
MVVKVIDYNGVAMDHPNINADKELSYHFTMEVLRFILTILQMEIHMLIGFNFKS